MRFGQHRSGGDVGILAVAFDDAAVRQFEPGPEAVAVDGQKAGSGIEPRRGQRHSLERRIQNVDLVDPLGGDRFDGPCHGFAFDNRPKLLAVALGHLLRIVEQGIVRQKPARRDTPARPRRIPLREDRIESNFQA